MKISKQFLTVAMFCGLAGPTFAQSGLIDGEISSETISISGSSGFGTRDINNQSSSVERDRLARQRARAAQQPKTVAPTSDSTKESGEPTHTPTQR